MRMLGLMLVIAGILVALLAVAAHAAAVRPASGKPLGAADTNRATASAVVSDAARLQEMGFEMPEVAETTKLSSSQAIAQARDSVAFDQSQPGVSVTTRKVRFTMTGLRGTLPNGVAAKDLTAWVVTVGGLKWPAHGGFNTPAPAPFTEMNVVIDANSGAEVTEFAYK